MRQNDTAVDFALPSQISIKIFRLWLQLLYKAVRQILLLHRKMHHDIRAINHQERRKEGRREECRKEGDISINDSRYCKK